MEQKKIKRFYRHKRMLAPVKHIFYWHKHLPARAKRINQLVKPIHGRKHSLVPIKSIKKTGFLLASLLLFVFAAAAQWQPSPNYKVGTSTGHYTFTYEQVPDPLKELLPLTVSSDPGATYYYQWQSSTSAVFNGFQAASSSTTGDYTYTFTQPLAQTTYFRVVVTRVTASDISTFYSNTVKITVVSKNWESRNYIREHDVLTQGVTDWKVVDQMSIGSEQKLQTTTYLDGLGRTVEKIDKQVATPASGSVWGDKVQFSQYDQYGRQSKQYLPYTTTNSAELGKYKTQPQSELQQYYTDKYNETSPYNSITYDNSPLNRPVNVKESGASWAAGPGNSTAYNLNDATDQVRMLSIGYTANAVPVYKGLYAAYTLLKNIYTDENGKQVIEYIDEEGLLVLKKVQLDNTAAGGDAGWICTYNVYDDFDRLRLVLQPEAVKFFDNNGWNFSDPNAAAVIDGLCFQYIYDDKGRNTWKKAPGAQPLNMIYDKRDRMVFTEDGNQAGQSVPQWTAYLFDNLDRPVITALYNPGETRAALQTDADNDGTVSTVTTGVPGTPIIDLVVDQRNTSITTYTARHAVDFVSDDGGSFESVDGDVFEAYIDPNAQTSNTSVTTANLNTLIPPEKLNNPEITTIIKYDFYDDYTYNGAKSFDNNFNNTQVYAAGQPNVLPIVPDARTRSLPTGTSVRVLGTGTFLVSSFYYDEKGHPIQVLEDNYLQGQDVTTTQYHWDGRVLSTYNKHTTTGTGYTNFGTLTGYSFDALGRVSNIQKTYGDNPGKPIALYEYDDMGRLLSKYLDPSYHNPVTGNADMERLQYSYNIHNQLTGVNKDYALKTPDTYNKWGHYFGYYLGYDNKDNVFNNAQLDGHVTGQLWNTQGDDVQRRYDYSYDNAGRLANAAYTEKQTPSDTWGNTTMDFSVSGSGGSIQYDQNGNLLSMLQKGVVPGQAPLVVDNLQYAYKAYSNQLKSVTDQTAATATNGALGDFKDGSNGAADDYVYDDNGNLVADLNKNIAGTAGSGAGITYNFLDKPERININGKGTVQIVYDADGNKLQRIFTPAATDHNTIITTYVNAFVYQQSIAGATSTLPATGTELSYINFEEGRIRIMKPVSQSDDYSSLQLGGNLTLPAAPSGNGGAGVFDYYLRDYQENVRMILTEETSFSSGTCTMETSRSTVEDATFGQQGAGNEVEGTRYAVSEIPGQSAGQGWQNSDIGSSVSKLVSPDGTTAAIGPNALLKVMAGDQLSASVQYYYQAAAGNNGSNTGALASTIISSLVQSISSGAAAQAAHGATAAIAGNLGGSVPFLNFVSPDAVTPGTAPRAYLTILFFDERFTFIPPQDDGSGSQIVRIQDGAGGQSDLSLTLANIKAPKNGYAYIYISNESSVPVYFDNLRVADNQGAIVEENHYYAYGLRIAGISSRKYDNGLEGSLKNQYLYNDKELWDDGGLDWYDYGFRNYDAQIGRFTQLDPLTDEFHVLTPYQYASDDPITNIDLDGLEGIPCPSVAGGFLDGANAGASTLSKVEGVISAVVHIADVTATAVNYQTASYIGSQTATMIVGAFQIGTTQQGNQGWQNVSILLAESSYNGAGSGDDWVKNPNPQGIKISDLSKESDDELLSDFRSTVHAYTRGVMTDVGNRMVSHFADNTGSDFSDEVLNNHIRASSQFQNKLSNTLELVKTKIQKVNGDLSRYGKPAEFDLPSFPKWDPNDPFSPNSLYTLIGGTQYGRITLIKYKYDAGTRSFTGIINVTIMDDFGVSVSDVKKAADIPLSKGIRAMWYLQNVRGYKPYRTVFNRQFQINF